MNSESSAVKWLAPVLVLLTVGCSPASSQLERVAKDWCLTIRASQVIPVYPLTEDLEPGDVFLVTMPIHDEAQAYEQSGFLPIDMHVTRLPGLDFSEVYDEGAYGYGKDVVLPRAWQFPKAGGNPATADPPAGSTRWSLAPRACFPTYNFEVRDGEGLKLAIPVQGIPVALSLMRAQTATGSVTITDAYVYGLPMDQIQDKVELWVSSGHKDDLARLRAAVGHDIYLRVVSRVYLAGKVSVALSNATTSSGSASAVQDVQFGLPELKSKTAAENYLEALQQLNAAIASTALPGGAIKFAHASERAVALEETFPRPVVIGYLGFDFPITEDGTIGPPLATQDRVVRKVQPKPVLGRLSGLQEDMQLLLGAIQGLKSDNQESVYGDAVKALGPKFGDLYAARRKEGLSSAEAFSRARAAYTGEPPSTFDRRVYGALREAWRRNR